MYQNSVIHWQSFLFDLFTIFLQNFILGIKNKIVFSLYIKYTSSSFKYVTNKITVVLHILQNSHYQGHIIKLEFKLEKTQNTFTIRDLDMEAHAMPHDKLTGSDFNDDNLSNNFQRPFPVFLYYMPLLTSNHTCHWGISTKFYIFLKSYTFSFSLSVFPKNILPTNMN